MIKKTDVKYIISHREVKALVINYLKAGGVHVTRDDIDIDENGYIANVSSSIKTAYCTENNLTM